MDKRRNLSNWINGKRVSGGLVGTITSPSDTADVVAATPQADVDEADAAVAAAKRAFPAWAELVPERRADILDGAGALLLARQQELGRLLSREEGKPIADGVAEVARSGRILRYFAGEALRVHGRTMDSLRNGVEIQTYRRPIGVCGLITPWNFPIAIPAWKLAPAIAFGNTVVLKPASQTPVLAEALVSILHEAGLPDGVVNLVIGPGAVGQRLVDHPDIQVISFTGSQNVGANIARGAGARQARVQLEMGGKNPLIVLDDANLDRAVQVALDGAFFATGQRCTASSRLIVQEGIHDRFVAALVDRLSSLRVGHALDPLTEVGPAVSRQQLETSYEYIDIALRAGGRLAAGGRRLERPTAGWYVDPTLICDTEPDMVINREEVFGPVASTIRVGSYEQALAIANGVEFGLSAGLCTTSLSHAQDFKRRAQAGMVMVNLPTAGVDYHVPFGGWKKSSHGPREQGYAAVDFFTQSKTAYTWA